MNLLMRIVAIIFLLNSLTSCSYLQVISKKPEARVKTISAEGVTPIAIKFKGEVEIDNPYDFSISIQKISFDFISEEKKLISANNELNKVIEAKGKTILPVYFQVEYADMGLALNDFLFKPQINTKFIADIYLGFPNSWDLPSSYKLAIEKKEVIKLREK